jgi:hypothetical protein
LTLSKGGLRTSIVTWKMRGAAIVLITSLSFFWSSAMRTCGTGAIRSTSPACKAATRAASSRIGRTTIVFTFGAPRQ